jgi:hypothetical protein
MTVERKPINIKVSMSSETTYPESANSKGYNKFSFSISKIQEYCDSVNFAEAVDYLEWVLKEARIEDNSDDIFNFKGKRSIAKQIEAELEYRRNQLKKHSPQEIVTPEQKGKMLTPIRWLGKHSQIVCLLEELRGKGFLAQGDDTTAIIEKHFCNDKGEPLKNTAQVWRNIKNNTKGVRKKDVLDEIVEKTRSVN